MKFTSQFYRDFSVANKTTADDQTISKLYSMPQGQTNPPLVYFDTWLAENPGHTLGLTNEDNAPAVMAFSKSTVFAEFKRQMQTIFELLKDWCKTNGLTETTLVGGIVKNILDEYIKKILPDPIDDALAANTAIALFTEGKRNLEQIILNCTAQDNPNRSRDKVVIQNLITYHLPFCIAGSHIAIHRAYDIITDDSLPKKLQRFRRKVIEEFALNFLESKFIFKDQPDQVKASNHVYAGEHIHLVNHLCNYVSSSYNIPLISDTHTFKILTVELQKTFATELAKTFDYSFFISIVNDLLLEALSITTINDLERFINLLQIFGDDKQFDIYSLVNNCDDPDKVVLHKKDTLMFEILISLVTRLNSEGYFNIDRPIESYKSKNRDTTITIVPEWLQLSRVETRITAEQRYVRESVFAFQGAFTATSSMKLYNGTIASLLMVALEDNNKQLFITTLDACEGRISSTDLIKPLTQVMLKKDHDLLLAVLEYGFVIDVNTYKNSESLWKLASKWNAEVIDELVLTLCLYIVNGKLCILEWTEDTKRDFIDLLAMLKSLDQIPLQSFKDILIINNDTKYKVFAKHLIQAIVSGNTQLALNLIDMKAPIDGQHMDQGCLQHATSLQQLDVAKALILVGADPLEGYGSENLCALEIAINMQFEELVNLMVQNVLPSKQRLLEKIISVTDCRTPMMRSIINGRMEALRLKTANPAFILPGEKLAMAKIMAQQKKQQQITNNSEQCEVVCSVCVIS